MQIPVIVLSGNLDQTTPEKVRDLGANAFISKPVKRDELLAELSRHIGYEPQPASARVLPFASSGNRVKLG
jgi:CheY-like chemotaxis protein